MSKISGLTELTDAALNDEIAVVDKSDTGQAATGSTKKITKGNFLAGVPYTIVGFENYIVLQGSGTRDLTNLQVGNIIFGTGSYYAGAIIYGTVNTSPVTQDSHITVQVNLGTGS